MIPATQLRNGTVFSFQGAPWKVLQYTQHFKGRGRGKVSVRAKNLKEGSVRELSFQSSDAVGDAEVTSRRLTFRYRSRDAAVFSADNGQIELPLNELDWEKNFLTKGQTAWVLFSAGQPIGVTLPASVTLRVTQTDPGVRGDTAAKTVKPARLETGYTTRVPLFVSPGDRITVDTDTGDYRGRA